MSGSHGLTRKCLLYPAAMVRAAAGAVRKRKSRVDETGVRHRVRFQIRTRQKSAGMLRDLVIVFAVFATALVLTSVLDLHSSFETASLELKGSPFQYDEVVVALGILAAALSAFAVRRWRELEVEIDERLVVEDALSESEERYRTLAEAAQDFIFIISPDRRIRYINTFAAAELGRPVARIVGKPGDEVLPAGMTGQGEFDVSQVFSDGRPLHMENLVLFSGRETWQSISLVPILDEGGAVGSVLGIARDITERKLAENELIEAHENLEQTVAERTDELKFVNKRLKTELDEKDKADEKLRAVNRALRTAKAANLALVTASGEPELLEAICRAAVEMGGYRFAWVGFAVQDEDRTVKPVASAGHEQGYLDAVSHSWGDGILGEGPIGVALKSASPCVVRDIPSEPDFAPWREESQLRDYASMVALPLTSGPRTVGALNIYASQKDAFDDEEVALLSELAGDLSYGINALRTKGERDEQLVMLRRTGEQLSLLLESLPIIFYTGKTGDDFGITYVSNNVQVVAGYSPDEITVDASFWADRVHPDDAPRIFEEMDKIFDRSLHEYEYRWQTADGSYKWFLDIHRLVKGLETKGSIVGMWLDITSRKNGEESLLKVKKDLESEAARRGEELQAALARLAESNRELNLQNRQAAIFGNMEDILQNCLDVREALTVFTQFGEELFPGDSGCVYVSEAAGGSFREAAIWGGDPPQAREFSREDCWSLRQQQPHVIEEDSAGARCRHLMAEEGGPYLCVPMKAGGRAIGVLTVLAGNGKEGQPMSSRLKLARGVAERLSSVLYNLKLREALLEGSIEDPFSPPGRQAA